MPYVAKKNGVYTTNGSGSAYAHGQPVKEGNFVGVAIKQVAAKWSDSVAAQDDIANGEKYFIVTNGVVEVTHVGGFAVGDAIYIDSSNALTKTNTGNTPFGRVIELAGTRGTPTGKDRIDLDIKTAVTAATF